MYVCETLVVVHVFHYSHNHARSSKKKKTTRESKDGVNKERNALMMKKTKKATTDTSKTGEDDKSVFQAGGIIDDNETDAVEAKAVGIKKKPTIKVLKCEAWGGVENGSA